MMSSKFKIILGVILAFGIVGILASHRWYKSIDNFTSLEKYGVYLRKKFPDVEHISTTSLQTLIRSSEAGIEPLLLIDCRKPEEYEISHIKGAVNLQTPEAVEAYLKQLEDKAPKNLIVYCSVGNRSAKLVKALQKDGRQSVKNVIGSIFSWANEDRPLINPDGRAAEKVHPYNPFWRRHLEKEKAIPIKFN